MVSFVFRREPQIPLFCSIYVLMRVLEMINKRRRINRRLIFNITIMSLFSPMGRNFVKKGSWVSRYTRIPKINRMKPEMMSSDLNFFILRGMEEWVDGAMRLSHSSIYSSTHQRELYLILQEKQSLSAFCLCRTFWRNKTAHRCNRCTYLNRKSC